MNLYRIYIGPKGGHLEYFDTVEAENEFEAYQKADKRKHFHWECAANLGFMKTSFQIFEELFHSGGECTPENFEKKINEYINDNIEAMVELT